MALTTNFSITLLNGSDTAGYSSINTIIQSIDTALFRKTNVMGMVMIYDDVATIPAGWVPLTAVTLGLPLLTPPYIYIKKTTL